MVAFIVFSLREIAASVDRSAQAWEKRDYYLKADAFRRDWAWVESAANRLHAVLGEERWSDLPVELAQLAPQFADVRVTQLTRPTTLWQGCYKRLMQPR
jgi:predicted molibdopterin-dependent oxidoreductase YjgC